MAIAKHRTHRCPIRGLPSSAACWPRVGLPSRKTGCLGCCWALCSMAAVNTRVSTPRRSKAEDSACIAQGHKQVSLSRAIATVVKASCLVLSWR